MYKHLQQGQAVKAKNLENYNGQRHIAKVEMVNTCNNFNKNDSSGGHAVKA